MSGQDYLKVARAALARSAAEAAHTPIPDSVGERSEESERRGRRFKVGHRYKMDGALLGVVHAAPPGLAAWRDEAGFRRAAVVTIAGETVLIADVSAALTSGYFAVIGVAP